MIVAKEEQPLATQKPAPATASTKDATRLEQAVFNPAQAFVKTATKSLKHNIEKEATKTK